MNKLFSILLCALLFSTGILIAQWMQTNGPYCGNIYSLAVIGSNTFAGTWGGGLYRSTDYGASWTTANNGLTDIIIRSLAVNGTNLFAGTSSQGVFLSTDYGENWTAVNTGLTNNEINCLIVIESNIYAGTWGGGIFKSTDDGANWTVINNGLTVNQNSKADEDIGLKQIN